MRIQNLTVRTAVAHHESWKSRKSCPRPLPPPRRQVSRSPTASILGERHASRMLSHHPQSLTGMTPVTAMVYGYPAAACLPARTLPLPRSAHEPHLFPNCCSQMCSRPCRTAPSASILKLESLIRRHQGGSSAPRRSPPARRACRAALPTTRWAQVRRRWRAAVPMMRAGSGPDAA